MAFDNLFIRTNKNIGGIRLDAVLSESHNNVASVTTNPVESGAVVSDNVVIEPKKINIVGEVTDTPLGAEAFGAIINTATSTFGNATAGNQTRSSAAYSAIVALQELREPISVQTKLKLYENMVITRISTTQDKDSSRIARMSIDLEEVIITSSVVVRLDAATLEAGTTRQQATSPQQIGRNENITPSDDTQTSVLKSVLTWLE